MRALKLLIVSECSTWHTRCTSSLNNGGQVELMNIKPDVVAMVMNEGEGPNGQGRSQRMATLLLRSPNGEMSLQTVSTDSTLGQYALSTGCFREGKPIFDPISKQILGYEMELMPSPLSSSLKLT
jgi:hypothetical protein